MFLHIHDSGGGRREESGHEEVPRRVCAGIEGKLHAVACCANVELQSHTSPIPDTVREHGGYCVDGLFELDKFSG